MQNNKDVATDATVKKVGTKKSDAEVLRSLKSQINRLFDDADIIDTQAMYRDVRTMLTHLMLNEAFVSQSDDIEMSSICESVVSLLGLVDAMREFKDACVYLDVMSKQRLSLMNGA
jgi:hypothetical protein